MTWEESAGLTFPRRTEMCVPIDQAEIQQAVFGFGGIRFDDQVGVRIVARGSDNEMRRAVLEQA